MGVIKYIYKNGDKVGLLIFIMEVERNARGERSALFRCHCGKEFITNITRARECGVKSCGCVRIKNMKTLMTTHGMSGNSLYTTWAGIKSRCYNKNNERFSRYGGRGIVVCEEWKNDFKAFHDYIIKLQNFGKPGYTIDRIKNNEGYKPGNLRWADPHTQLANQSLTINNKSGYKGVSLKQHGRYSSRITINYVEHHLGYFDTSIEAARARNDFVIKNKLELGYLNKI